MSKWRRENIFCVTGCYRILYDVAGVEGCYWQGGGFYDGGDGCRDGGGAVDRAGRGDMLPGGGRLTGRAEGICYWEGGG